MLKCCSIEIYNGDDKLKLGDFVIKNVATLAPMAGITDRAMREISMDFGAGACTTELISSNGIVFGDKKTLSYIDTSIKTSPIGVQIFGYSPEIMAKATEKLMSYISQYPNIKFIDINMGCPAPKIVKSGSGSALLKDADRALSVAESVVKKSSIPVTVKMRLGFDKNNIVCFELAKKLQDLGVCAITLHARTAKQMYSGKADWEAIKRLKSELNIAVIGNGDVYSVDDAKKMLEFTNCDFIAVGRGAVGNPWIFQNIKNMTENKPYIEVKPIDKMKVMINHLEKLFEYKGLDIGLKEGRRHASYYIKDFKNAAEYRQKIFKTNSFDEIKEIANEIIEINQF